jgi:hypothetical protein
MVRIEIRDEAGCISEPARVRVYEDERLVAEIIGKVEPKEGADGGLYPCVTLEHQCICSKGCDCQNPKPKRGMALVSNECPVHNEVPQAHPDCLAAKHHAAAAH